MLSLPESLLKIRKLATSIDSDVYDVEKCVAGDPPFAGYLLKLANSSLYATGKTPCTSIADAIRRQGIQAVAQLAMVYALQRKHMNDTVPRSLQELLKRNWNRSSSLAAESVRLYQGHRAEGSKASRRIDVSDVLAVGTLYYSGTLALLSACAVEQGQAYLELHAPDALEQMALGGNNGLLPDIFRFWNLPIDQCQRLLRGDSAIPDLSPLHATDYVRSVLLSRSLNTAKEKELFISQHHSELERLENLGIGVA